MKKRLRLLLIPVCVLIAGAILLGVLNALVGGGSWTFGWSSYRYDDSGYEIGEGTIVPSDGLKQISVDWIDGEVRVVRCQDRYPSVEEDSEISLTEDSLLRWRVSEDGTTLEIRYRKSSMFLGSGNRNKDKTLILRIPENLFAQLESVEVKTVSGAVSVSGIRAEHITVTTSSGAVSVGDGVICRNLSVETGSGNVSLMGGTDLGNAALRTTSGNLRFLLPEDAAFTLRYESKSGKLINDFPGTEEGSYGTGEAAVFFEVRTVSGDLTVERTAKK